MPCRDWDDCENLSKQQDYLNVMIDRNVKPSLLCEACSILENNDLLHLASDELKNWYKNHEALEEDKIRLETAEKLSERDRRVLEINIQELRRKVLK